MTFPSPGRRVHRRARTLAACAAAALAVSACGSQSVTGRSAHPSTATATRPAPTSTGSPSGSGRTTPATTPPVSTSTTPAPSRSAVTTRGGMWWGVDSTTAITAASLANVEGWYLGGHRPQFWGRYLRGSFAVRATELAFARKHGIYVYLIVTDHNCSQCGGHDVCGHDRTADQASDDALEAVRDAKDLDLPRGTVLFKDIEQVSSCRGEPTSTYLLAWYAALERTIFRTGFYGNTYRQSFDFPVAYCAAVARDATFASHVVLDMNEPEPQLAAPRKTIGPANAPRFAPYQPRCTPPGRTMIWQYGESRSNANLTDVDEARPNTPGMLAPDGSVT